MDSPASVVFSFGMGVDSLAILWRWILHPQHRDFDWPDLVCVTAMTGDEYQATSEVMQRHVLPQFRAHRIRYVQLARAGQQRAAGYRVLSDTRQPARMLMRGPWALSEELGGNGTLAQIASGQRRCSARAKGEPLDAWITDEIAAGRIHSEHRHVIGFSADEQRRIARDSTYTRNARRPWYPLAEAGWSRQDCELFLLGQLGARVPRSCCEYCPFQLGGGTEELLRRWREDPAAGARTLLLERGALALNPRMRAFGSVAAEDLVLDHGLTDVLAAARDVWRSVRWSVYDVRRVFTAKDGDPTRKGITFRSVRCLHTGSRSEATAALAEIAARRGLHLVRDRTGIHRIPRAWVMSRTAEPRYPAPEHFLTTAPAGVQDKERTGFAARWSAATAAHGRAG